MGPDDHGIESESEGDSPTMQRLNPYGYNLFSRAGTE